MQSDTSAAAVLAAALWVIFASAMFGGFPAPADHAWVVTSSEKIASHPALVRVAHPYARRTASVSAASVN